MLILTRRVGQTIRIGDEVEVTVVQVSGDQVRLGITAPRSVRVVRLEVIEEIARENAAAAESAAAVESIEAAEGCLVMEDGSRRKKGHGERRR